MKPTQCPLIEDARMQQIMQPYLDLTAAGFQSLSELLVHLHMSLKEIQRHSQIRHEQDHERDIFETFDSSGEPYNVNYQGHHFMDAMCWDTSNPANNVTCSLQIPGLGISSASVFTFISAVAQLQAGISPWVPLNFRPGTIITLDANPVAGHKYMVLVRYGNVPWGGR